VAPIKIAHITAVEVSLRVLLLNQMLRLKAQGFEVCGISSPGPGAAELESTGIRHIPVPIPRNIRPLADLRALLQLARLLRRERFTIVHTHFSKPGLLGQAAARLAGVPVAVHTVHGYAFHENMGRLQKRFYVLLEKVAGSCSDLIFSQNHEDLVSAIDEGICKAEKIKHLGNGIDLARFDPGRISQADVMHKRVDLGLDEHAPVVGFVGRLALKRKGFADFLSAARIIQARLPNARFLIIGAADHGRPDAATPEMARQYGLHEQCIFPGWLPNEQMPLMLSLMDVIMLPSLLEGLPRSLIEASAMGVPLVATNVKGNREVVLHGRNGFLAPLGDVECLAEAAIQLLLDPVKARSCSREGRKIALMKFDERAVFQKIEVEYTRLLGNKGLIHHDPMAESAEKAV
jgi:glycosyltransferase involved in cell wall biosynthesis